MACTTALKRTCSCSDTRAGLQCFWHCAGMHEHTRELCRHCGDFCTAMVPQDLTLHTKDGKPHPEVVAVLLMSQAPTLQVLSMHHHAVPQQYLPALASLRSLTHLTVRNNVAVCLSIAPCICRCSTSDRQSRCLSGVSQTSVVSQTS